MATFIVNTTLDELDGSVADGDVSLRDAIAAASAAGGADTIGFDATVFDGEAADTLRLTQGQIAITDELTIDGACGVTITGDANGDDVTLAGGITDVVASLDGEDRLDDNSRIFDAGASLTLDGLTLTGGRTTDIDEGGAAVRSQAALTLIDSRVSGNSTVGELALGGGIYCFSDVTVTNSTVSGNSTAGDAARGGGIYSRGTVTLTSSTVSDNSTVGNASDGGGTFGLNSVTLTNSTISGNSTAGFGADGGGIFGFTVTVTNSTVSGNSTVGGSASGGGIVGGPVTVTDSTVSGNSTAGYDASGGGLWGNSVTVTNSAVSGNSTAGDFAHGGGISAEHGYLGYGTGSVTVANSTISGNSTAGVGAEGGGISAGYTNDGVFTAGPVALSNCLVLGNATTGVGGDEVVGIRTLTGGNILGTNIYSGSTDTGDTTAAAVFAATTEIAPGVLAGVLADNGGPTETIALRLVQGNPAIGGADPATATATDQRGVARDAHPDLGAFEAEEVGPPAPFRIEAETLARVSGFRLEHVAAASGDQVIMSPNPKVEAHARFTFTEQDGVYDLDLGYFDENDGKSRLAVFVDGVEIDSFRFKEHLGCSHPNARTHVERHIANVEIETGDVVELVGHSQHHEPLRIDYLDFTFVDDLFG